VSGGSSQPEEPTDQQCQHCGTWWAFNGHPPHERNCDWAEYPNTLAPLTDATAEAILAGDVEDNEDEFDGFKAVESDRDSLADAKTEVVEAVEEAGSEGLDPEGSTPTTDARADGGVEAVAPPEPDDPGPDEDDDEATCPSCGSADWFDPGKLPPEILARDPDLATYDRACEPCSTEDGHLAGSVEVYNA